MTCCAHYSQEGATVFLCQSTRGATNRVASLWIIPLVVSWIQKTKMPLMNSCSLLLRVCIMSNMLDLPYEVHLKHLHIDINSDDIKIITPRNPKQPIDVYSLTILLHPTQYKKPIRTCKKLYKSFLRSCQCNHNYFLRKENAT